MKDYSESLLVISKSYRELYEALQRADMEQAKALCDDIIVAAREVRAWINWRK